MTAELPSPLLGAPAPEPRWVKDAVKDMVGPSRKKAVAAAIVSLLGVGIGLNFLFPHLTGTATPPTPPTQRAPVDVPPALASRTTRARAQEPPAEPKPLPIARPATPNPRTEHRNDLPAPVLLPVPTLPANPKVLPAPTPPDLKLPSPVPVPTPPLPMPEPTLPTPTGKLPIDPPVLIQADAKQPAIPTPTPVIPAVPSPTPVIPAVPPASTPSPSPIPLPTPLPVPAMPEVKPLVPAPVVPTPELPKSKDPVPVPTPVTLPKPEPKPLPKPEPLTLPKPEPIALPPVTPVESPKPIALPKSDPLPKPDPSPFKPVSSTPGELPKPTPSKPETPKLSPPAEKPAIRPVANTQPLERPRTDFDVDLHDPKAGETYESISKLFYGDAKYAEALRAFNGNRSIGTGGSVQVPPMYVLRKRYPGLSSRSVPPPEPGPPSAPVESNRPTVEWRSGSSSYAVPRQGMTMWDVAEDVFGDRKQWQRVWDANPRLDPNAPLPAGTKLALPSDARAGR